MADACDDLGAVGLDLHPPAPAIALLAAPEVPVHGFQRDRYSGWEPLKGRHQVFAVGLPGSLESQHQIRSFIVPDANIYLYLAVLYDRRRVVAGMAGGKVMLKFLLWLILLFFCWPLALLALVLYPVVWLLLLPFRLVGIAVEGALSLVWAVVTLPARLLRGI
jgi:hypothetical protein